MKKKIIYVSISKLTDRIYDDYYIKSLLDDKFDVEYWDVTSLVREHHVDGGEINEGFLSHINSYFDFKKRVSENTNAVFWMMLDLNPQTKNIYKILNQYRAVCITIQEAHRPLYLLKKTFLKKIKTYLINPSLAYKVLNQKFFDMTTRGEVFKIVFRCGLISKNLYSNFKSTVYINSIDYEKFKIASESNARLVSDKYVVYLDSYMPYHNDNKLLGRVDLQPDLYYPALNNFFKALEEKFHLRVIVAAHPSAIYKNNPFDSREIYRLNSAQLCKYADFVLGDCSLSLCYPVLFRKPIFLIVTNEMLSLWKNDPVMLTINAYSKFLNRPIINIENYTLSDLDDHLKFSNARYQSYEELFLKNPEVSSFTNYEIIKKNILKLMI